MENETITAFQKQLTLENINKCVNSVYCVVSLQKIKNITLNKLYINQEFESGISLLSDW